MNAKTVKLEELCSIKTGSPVSRAKAIPEGGEGREVRVLLPKAMQNGLITDDDLAIEIVGDVKEEHFTHEGDVVIKLSTPFDSVYIDKDHEGIMVTSFGMILRKLSGVELDMQYLSMFLNSPQTNAILAAVSMGQTSTMATLKRKTIAVIDIPILPLKRQKLLGDLFREVRGRQAQFRRLIELDDELLNNQLVKAIWGEQE